MGGYRKETVRKLVKLIDREKLLLPNIQSARVWEPEQILSLLDSLLRGYPVSNMLFWRTDCVDVVARTFVRQYWDGLRFSDFQVQPSPGTCDYVLEGQQRLQGLYIALMGSYNSKVVHIDLLAEPDKDELLFPLAFFATNDKRKPKSAIPLRDLAMEDETSISITRRLISCLREQSVQVGEAEKSHIEDVVACAHYAFAISEALTYFLADSSEE